jgi:hypothetical protein
MFPKGDVPLWVVDALESVQIKLTSTLTRDQTPTVSDEKNDDGDSASANTGDVPVQPGLQCVVPVVQEEVEVQVAVPGEVSHSNHEISLKRRKVD